MKGIMMQAFRLANKKMIADTTASLFKLAINLILRVMNSAGLHSVVSFFL
jgi:hypothetical protein